MNNGKPFITIMFPQYSLFICKIRYSTYLFFLTKIINYGRYGISEVVSQNGGAVENLKGKIEVIE